MKLLYNQEGYSGQRFFLFILFLFSFHASGYSSQEYKHFPRHISTHVYQQLTLEKKYAYLNEIWNALKSFAEDIHRIRDRDVDLDRVEKYLEENPGSIPDFENIEYVNVNSWHLHMVLRFLSRLPINVYPEARETEFQNAWLEKLDNHPLLKLSDKVDKYRYVAWLSYVATFPELFSQGAGTLPQESYWKEWNTLDGVQPFSDEPPAEEIIDYIISPVRLRIAAAMISEHNENLKIKSNADVATYKELTKEISLRSMVYVPKLIAQYKYVWDRWVEIQNTYDEYLARRIDNSQVHGDHMCAKFRPTDGSCILLLIHIPLTVKFQHKLFWGTMNPKDRSLSNATEDRFLKLLMATQKLFEANIAVLIYQFKGAEKFKSLKLAEEEIIKRVSDELGMKYPAHFEYSW